jgi:DNA processing protein
MDRVESWLAIAHAPGLHAGLFAAADPAFTGLTAALPGESRSSLAALGLREPTISALKQPDPAALRRDLRWLEGPNRQLVTWGSSVYPELLSTIPDPPLVLFVEGDADVMRLPSLAMVGSRSPSVIGRETAMHFASHLAGDGLVITSGLALGIDAASHRGSLQNDGGTIAVLGCGLDRIYPRENAELAQQVARCGALVSEFPTGSPPLPANFPRRNRVISGLSVGTLVVEAALKSGSLITARLAAEQGREVFAIPGSIHSPQSRGCHRLIRQGAKLVECVDDIFSELGALLASLRSAAGPKLPVPATDSSPALDKAYEILLDAVGFEAASIDALIARTGMESGTISSMLLILELDGWVEQQRGGTFCRRLPGRRE